MGIKHRGIAIGVILVIPILVIASYIFDGYMKNSHSVKDSTSPKYVVPLFRKSGNQTVLDLDEISCYKYLPFKPNGGIPSNYQEERPLAELAARDCKKRLPHALIIGVKKCGTITMGTFLGLHPSISYTLGAIPNIIITKDSMAKWRKMFSLTSSKQIAVTGYPGLFSDMQHQLEQMMRDYLPHDTKLILLLRDPVQRLVSDYVHMLTIASRLKGDERKRFRKSKGLMGSFEATVLNESGEVNPSALAVRLGMYARGIRSLYQHVPRERVIILDGNAFSKDPFPSLVEVERFLKLPSFFKRYHFVFNEEKHFYCANVSSRPDMGCMSSAKGRSHPKVNDDLLKQLYDFYRPFNKELKEDFGLEFSWITLS